MGSLEETADRLYALPLEEFTAARDRAAAETRAEDRDLAARIKRLPKPQLAAWVVNMVVRHETAQLEQVLALGDSLRAAQESLAGDELRELGKQRRRLISAVTSQARALAARLGHKVGEGPAQQVEATLHAALVDAAAAAAVRSGLLVRPMAATGVDAVDASSSLAWPEAGGWRAASVESPPVTDATDTGTTDRPKLTVVQDEERRRAEHQQRLDKARRHARETKADLSAAESRLGREEKRVAALEARSLQLQSELEELQRRVADVEHQLESTDDKLSEAEDSRETAAEEYAEARVVAEEAAAILDDLESKAGSRQRT